MQKTEHLSFVIKADAKLVVQASVTLITHSSGETPTAVRAMCSRTSFQYILFH